MGTPWPSYGPPKLVESKGIERFLPPKPSPLSHELGWESKGKEPQRVPAYICPNKSYREQPKNGSEKNTKKRL
jgi:hypothetical protein